MWFFLFGNKGYYDRLGYIITRCPECKVRGVFWVEQERKRFTVYFVPTFQYSKKQFLVCTACQEGFEVARELKPELAKKLISQEELASLVRRGKLTQLAGGGRRGRGRAARNRCPGCRGKVATVMSYCPNCGNRLK